MRTTPLSATHGVLEGQVDAFHRGKARNAGAGNRLYLQRGLFLVSSEAERQRMVEIAHRYSCQL